MISILLLEPQNPRNIGSVARVMKNFDFYNLVLVKPCKITREAEIMAVHAFDVIENAKICNNFKTALKNFDYVVGTTAVSSKKDDEFLRIGTNPEELSEKLAKAKGRVAIVFGREDSGLSNEELELCDLVVTIPTSEKYKSMNISHAVAVVLYELSRAASCKLRAASHSYIRLASKKELFLIKSTILAMFNKIPYESGKRKVFKTMLNRIVGRAFITGREANTLIGVLKKINKKLK